MTTNYDLNNSRVFLTNRSGHDYSDAEKFGSIVAVTIGKVSPFNTDRTVSTIRSFLKDHNYNPEADWVLFSGNAGIAAFVFGVATLIAIQQNSRHIRLLIFDAHKRTYEPRHVAITAMQNDVEVPT